MIIIIAVTLLFIVLRITVTVFNFVSNPKLTRVNRQYTDLVSILIPARNEAHNITTLLQSIVGQDYKNYEVIIYDDQSDDDTYRQCAVFAAAYPHISVIKGEGLPDGWLGKNNACHQLAAKAKGKYYLFLDADCRVHNSLFNSAVHRMQLNKLGLLSLLPNQHMETLGEHTTVPLLHLSVFSLLPMRLVYLYKRAIVAAACGQFMLFDAAGYDQNKWHQQVKAKVVEDVELMRLLKSASYSGEFLLANNMITCRMYTNYKDAIDGFGKNALAVFNNSTPALILYILLLIGGPAIILATLNLNLILYLCGLIALTRVMVSLASGQSVGYNLILHPVQMANMAIIAFISIQRSLTGANVWKGRKVK